MICPSPQCTLYLHSMIIKLINFKNCVAGFHSNKLSIALNVDKLQVKYIIWVRLLVKINYSGHTMYERSLMVIYVAHLTMISGSYQVKFHRHLVYDIHVHILLQNEFDLIVMGLIADGFDPYCFNSFFWYYIM